MFHYYLDRGLSVVELLSKVLRDKTWLIPDLICDEVLSTIKENVEDIKYYSIDQNLNWSTIKNSEDKDNNVIYIIDYFGRAPKIKFSPNTILIRDSVWFPHPFEPIYGNQIWFNSLRKIFRGAKGASIISPYRLPSPEVQGVFHHPNLTIQEMNVRFRNFNHLRKIIPELAIDKFEPDFPTVFPLKLKNRDEVLEKAGLTGKLPGMWKNTHNLNNPLYEELTFLPIDSRFSEDQLSERVEKIKLVMSNIDD